MDTLIVESQKKAISPILGATEKISKGALKAIKEGLAEEKEGIFMPHDEVMREAKRIINQWEQKMLN